MDYSELQASIADYLDDDQLSSQITDFIKLAEFRHRREIRIREMLKRSYLQIPKGHRYLSLPHDFLDLKYIRVVSEDTVRKYLPDLLDVSVHEMTRCSSNEPGFPTRYTVHEHIEFDRDADKAYPVELFYYVALEPLSARNPSNVLLEQAPDVYLYASLLASAPFLHNDERLKTWADLYTQGKEELNRMSLDSRRGGPLISRVSGPTP